MPCFWRKVSTAKVKDAEDFCRGRTVSSRNLARSFVPRVRLGPMRTRRGLDVKHEKGMALINSFKDNLKNRVKEFHGYYFYV